MSQLKFSLGQQVCITVSGEAGEVIGHAEYLTKTENSYYLRYKNADGRAVQEWWDESALAPHTPCRECGDTGRARIPYSSEYGPCWECNAATRPSSNVSATTEASVGSPDLPGGSIK